MFLQDDLVEESKQIKEVKQIVTFVNSSEFKKYLQASPLVQQIALVRIAPSTKIITSPVPSRSKDVSEFLFFWDPEAKDTKEVTAKSATEFAKISTLVLNPVIVSSIASALIQEISIVHASTPVIITEV